MSATVPSSSNPDPDAPRGTTVGDVPTTQSPPLKSTDPKTHYLMCGGMTAIGLVIVALVVLGALGTPLLEWVFPWLALAATILLIPGLVGLYRGPGEPSTYVIPRPKNRHPVDYGAGAGGAGGPVPGP